MGLFSKMKSNARIVVEGVEIEFDRAREFWNFLYRGTEFSSHGNSLILPSKAELDAILDTLNGLKSTMKASLKKGFNQELNSKVDDGESYLVDVKTFVTERSFVVSWIGGKSWGDMGVDFTINAAQLLMKLEVIDFSINRRMALLKAA
jgi:hypothetical protein